jgi:hypothetical protein
MTKQYTKIRRWIWNWGGALGMAITGWNLIVYGCGLQNRSYPLRISSLIINVVLLLPMLWCGLLWWRYRTYDELLRSEQR